MHFALLLPDLLASRLAVIFAGAHELHRVRTMHGLEGHIRRAPVDAVFVDPLLDAERILASLAQLRQRFPSVRVLVYTRLVPEALQLVADLAREGFHQILLHRFDDSREQLEALLGASSSAGLRTKLLERLSPTLMRLPPGFRDSVARLFERPRAYSGVHALARSLSVAPSTFYRRCWDAGFASPGRLFVGARVLTGYSYLREPGYTIGDVATKLGYRNARVFAANVRAVFDAPPRRVRLTLDDEAAVARIGQWILSA